MPRRVTGATLRALARASGVPVLGDVLRPALAVQLGLAQLRSAEVDPATAPYEPPRGFSTPEEQPRS